MPNTEALMAPNLDAGALSRRAQRLANQLQSDYGYLSIENVLVIEQIMYTAKSNHPEMKEQIRKAIEERDAAVERTARMNTLSTAMYQAFQANDLALIAEFEKVVGVGKLPDVEAANANN